MKIITDFDFCNAVKDVNGNILLFKVVRNNQKRYAHLFPIYSAIALICKQYADLDAREVISIIIRTYGYLISIETIAQMIVKILNQDHLDAYTEKSIRNLKRLVTLLERINVSTNYEKLLESELYTKKYSLDTEDRTIPAIMSKKYIYVPAYGYDGEEKTVSILQEHVIGSKEFILSQDEPDREYRRVLAKSNI